MGDILSYYRSVTDAQRPKHTATDKQMTSLSEYNSRLFKAAHARVRSHYDRKGFYYGGSYAAMFRGALRIERSLSKSRGWAYVPKAQREETPVKTCTLPSEGAKDALIRRIAQKQAGRFFTVEFTKRTNGENRVMNALRDLPEEFRGNGHKFDPTAKRLLQVFDVQKGAPRFVSLDGVHRVSAAGYRFEFDGLEMRTYRTA